MMRLAAGAAAALLLGVKALDLEGLKSVEVNSHHFSAHHASTERAGRLMRRDIVRANVGEETWEAGSGDPKSALKTAGDSGDAGPLKASDVKWGGYRFNFVEGTDRCVESGVNSWEGKSIFETWTGTHGGLTLAAGTTSQKGMVKQIEDGLRIYKAACPNSTAVKVGGVTDIPIGTTSIDIVFGISMRCTGDCAPFMVSVLDEDDNVKHRWCFNREGDDPAIKCHTTKYVKDEKWNRVTLDLANVTNFADGLKLALEVYTSGDFRFLPTLPGEVGLGGRAMVLIDSLIFGPSTLPNPDRSYKGTSAPGRQSLGEACKDNSWCMDKYRCSSGWFTEGKGRCNEERNCPDDSDEVGCEYQKSGFHGEFFLNHARLLHKGSGDVDGLTNPDIRRLNEVVDYDADDFWKKLHARDNFAAKWTGNFSIKKQGHYFFNYQNSGEAKLKISGLGSASGKTWDVKSDSWTKLPAGRFQLKLTYVHLVGPPSLTLKYAGKDTRGSKKVLGRSLISATMTGSRCDTMMCADRDSLITKPKHKELLCDSVPCKEEVDTRTCCTRQYKVVSCGDYRTCALDMHGRPVCWGSWEGFNEQWKQHPGPFRDISTRGKYICAVYQESGKVDCWRPDNTSAPLVDYSIGDQMTNVSVGGEHTCALRTSGFPACTGTSVESGDLLPQTLPPSNIEFSKVVAGEDFTCGITALDTDVKCWGANARGQVTPPDQRSFTHLAAGKSHACGISKGSVSCWGWNNDGQATAPSGKDFAQVAAGGMHTCALKEDGKAVCWGANADGQSEPVEDDAPYSSISTGTAHSCGIRASDKEVVCWGSNFEEDADGSLMWRGQAEPPPAGIWP